MFVINKLGMVAMTLILAACVPEADSNKASNSREGQAVSDQPMTQAEVLPVSQDCVIDYGNIDKPAVYKIHKLPAPGGSLKVDIQRTEDRPGPVKVVAVEYVNEDYVYKIIQSSSAELNKVEKITGGVRITGSVTLGVQTDMHWKQSARQPVTANLGAIPFENIECSFPQH
ncbi:MAG: hypothetical protein ABI644_09030 [Arenimonas sp.]